MRPAQRSSAGHQVFPLAGRRGVEAGPRGADFKLFFGAKRAPFRSMQSRAAADLLAFGPRRIGTSEAPPGLGSSVEMEPPEQPAAGRGFTSLCQAQRARSCGELEGHLQPLILLTRLPRLVHMMHNRRRLQRPWPTECSAPFFGRQSKQVQKVALRAAQFDIIIACTFGGAQKQRRGRQSPPSCLFSKSELVI